MIKTHKSVQKLMLNAFRKLCSEPWAITPEMLQVMINITRREHSPLSVHDIEALRREMGRPADGTQNSFIRGSVGVIPIYGPMFGKADMFTEISGATSTERVAQDLTRMAADPRVESVILDMDTPGGEVRGISELADYIKAYPKPIKAYVSAMACSAGYWLASAANEIVTDKTSTLGSVGVVLAVPGKDETDPYIEFVSSNAALKRPDPESEAGKSAIQSYVDKLGLLFENSVLGFRPDLKPETLASIAGHVTTGEDAVHLKLADRLGSLEGLIAEMSANTDNSPWRSDMKVNDIGRRVASALGLSADDSIDGQDIGARLKEPEPDWKALEAQLTEKTAEIHRTKVRTVTAGLEARAVGTPTIRLLLNGIGNALPPTAESISMLENLGNELSALAQTELLVGEVVPGSIVLSQDPAAKIDYKDDPTILHINREKARKARK